MEAGSRDETKETGISQEIKMPPVIMDENEDETVEMQEYPQKEHNILFVEDDSEVLEYLSEQLKKYFNVYTHALCIYFVYIYIYIYIYIYCI